MAFTPKKTAFSFIPPVFVFKDGTRLDTTSDSGDVDSMKSIYSMVTQWCILNELLVPAIKNKEQFVPNITTEMKSGLVSCIYSTNLKRLCVKEYLNDTLVQLNDTEQDNTMSRLIDLHIRILTEIDSTFLNLYVNRLIHTLSNLYPDLEKDEDLITWEDFFSEYPYLWLLFPIQWILRSTTPVYV